MSTPNDSAAPWEDNNAVNAEGEPSGTTQAASPESIVLAERIAVEYVGFWNRLISRTNWEKGKVILTWRTKLIEAGLPRSLWSDESLSQRIGNVSSQHVGRLRRVYERFGDAERYAENPEYSRLYWSHFQAALDWEDADQWLKKASDESLSVAQMRIARWESLGAPADKTPKPEEIVTSEYDEDVSPMNDSDIDSDGGLVDLGASKRTQSQDDEKEQENNAEEPKTEPSYEAAPEGKDVWLLKPKLTGEVLQKMRDLPELPQVLAEPVDAIKRAVLELRLGGWSEQQRDAAVAWLRALADLITSKDA